ncbi:hypothetical protein G3I78_42905 [Streptomyces sp. SID13726]|nr:hypothetical protein [Streptomyces sp. SID13726]
MAFVQGAPGFGRIEFTENDEFIDFKLHPDRLSLRAVPSYVDREVSCAVDDFLVAGDRFIREGLARVTDGYPSLAENRFVRILGGGMGQEESDA